MSSPTDQSGAGTIGPDDSHTEAVRAGGLPPATGSTGVRMGIDVGSVRVGIALSDPQGILAHPLMTVGPEDLDEVVALIREHEVTGVVVGLPKTLRGDEGPAADITRRYAQDLASRMAVPVRLVDERLTTVTAHRQLGSSGLTERGRRSVVDQAAAVLILQGALDLESNSGSPAGELITDGTAAPPRARKPRHARRRKEHG